MTKDAYYTAADLAKLPRLGKNSKALRDLSDREINALISVEDEGLNFEKPVDWTKAIFVPEQKQLISIRLDKDILAFFKNQGRGYQTHINAVLRHYIEAKA